MLYSPKGKTMKELLKQIAINKNVEIKLSRYVTVNFSYLDGGNIELCIDNHGPVKEGKQTLILDDTLENKKEVLQGFCEIDQVKEFVEKKTQDIDDYTAYSQDSVNEILGYLQWEQKVDAEDEYYLAKILDIAQNGSTIQIDKGKLFRLAYTDDGTGFQILNFEKLPDQKLSVEIEEHSPNEIAEILAKSYAKNKDVLSEKIDKHIENANNKLEEIKHRMNELFDEFDINQTENLEQNM